MAQDARPVSEAAHAITETEIGTVKTRFHRLFKLEMQVSRRNRSRFERLTLQGCTASIPRGHSRTRGSPWREAAVAQDSMHEVVHATAWEDETEAVLLSGNFEAVGGARVAIDMCDRSVSA